MVYMCWGRRGVLLVAIYGTSMDGPSYLHEYSDKGIILNDYVYSDIIIIGVVMGGHPGIIRE